MHSFLNFIDRRWRTLAALLVLLLVLMVGVVLWQRFRSPVVPVPAPVRFVCPLRSDPQPSETASCRDCMFYPVDKTHRLHADYAPDLVETGLPGGGLIVPAARDALAELFKEAESQGIFPVITSAYRSYEEQVATFNTWIMSEWQSTLFFTQALATADRYSARPGHSEHQLGTTVDLNCRGCVPFDDKSRKNLALWKFLEDNAHRFGFVISYPRNAENRTGYKYEPWHIRYVGVVYATELYKQGYAAGNDTCLLALLQNKKRF